MFAYCGNNPINYIDETGEYYTPGQIHDFVIEDICNNNPNKRGKNTYMIYKEPYLKGSKYHFYGYCDIFDIETHEIWEVKRFGGGSSCSLAAAERQLRNYVKNGILNYFAPWDQYTGGQYTQIPMNTFLKCDVGDRGIYVISYWDTGLGVIFYDYYYLPAPEEYTVAMKAVAYGMGAGAGLYALCVCFSASEWYWVR